MGEAADDMWDDMMQRETDFSLMLNSIINNCQHPDRACKLVTNDYDEDEDNLYWLPYKCIVCGEEFDYP